MGSTACKINARKLIPDAATTRNIFHIRCRIENSVIMHRAQTHLLTAAVSFGIVGNPETKQMAQSDQRLDSQLLQNRDSTSISFSTSIARAFSDPHRAAESHPSKKESL